MTEYVVLHPAGDVVHVYAAMVDAPILVPKDQAERTVERLALERRLAELRALDGEQPIEVHRESTSPMWNDDQPQSTLPAPRYAGAFKGADGVTRTELHHSERKAGPGYACECGQAFWNGDAYRKHAATCGLHMRVVSPPNQEPGAYVHGAAEQRFSLG